MVSKAAVQSGPYHASVVLSLPTPEAWIINISEAKTGFLEAKIVAC